MTSRATLLSEMTFVLVMVFMQGVNIGDGAIIRSRAVVTMDVAPYTIVAEFRQHHKEKVLRRRYRTVEGALPVGLD